MIFFTCFASHLRPVQTAQFSRPSSVLFPPNSEEKQKLQVTRTQRDARGCPTLKPLSKPQALSLVPPSQPGHPGERGPPHRDLSGHTPDPRDDVSSVSPKKHLLLSRDSQVEKLLSLYSRTTQRSLSFGLTPRGGRTCRGGGSWHYPPPSPRVTQQIQRCPWHGGLPSPSTPACVPRGHPPFGMGRRGKKKSPIFFLFPQPSDSTRGHRSDRRDGERSPCPVPACRGLPVRHSGLTRARLLPAHPRGAAFQICAGRLEKTTFVSTTQPPQSVWEPVPSKRVCPSLLHRSPQHPLPVSSRKGAPGFMALGTT